MLQLQTTRQNQKVSLADINRATKMIMKNMNEKLQNDKFTNDLQSNKERKLDRKVKNKTAK